MCWTRAATSAAVDAAYVSSTSKRAVIRCVVHYSRVVPAPLACQVCYYTWAISCVDATSIRVVKLWRDGAAVNLTTGASGADINLPAGVTRRVSCDATLSIAYSAGGSIYSDAAEAPLQFMVRNGRHN